MCATYALYTYGVTYYDQTRTITCYTDNNSPAMNYTKQFTWNRAQHLLASASHGWLVVLYVQSTARSFRDGAPIYCPLRRT